MIELISPAKINLFLKVLGRRPDSYHEIASLFQAISLHDTLKISLADEDLLLCNHPEIPTDSSNLIFKAVNLFRRKTGFKFSVKISLIKNIPHEAGLGGGSSNAATTLWALNQLHDYKIPLEELICWSGEIGSDITFFLSEGTAFCTGRGEILQHMNALPNKQLWVAKPDEGLSTPLVFKHLDLEKLPFRDTHHVLQNFYLDRPQYFNDLEAPAFKIKPYLKSLKGQLLQAGFETVLMTGSGTAFYCLGKQSPPKISGVTFFPAYFIRRSAESWYQIEH